MLIPYSSEWLKKRPGSDKRLSVVMAEHICACILAVLHNHDWSLRLTGKERYNVASGTWKYVDIEDFIREYKTQLLGLLPELKPPPTKVSMRVYVQDLPNLELFTERFQQWTELVATNYPDVQKCDRATARIGLDPKPKKTVIWAAYEWREQNPKVTKIVREYFPLKRSNSPLDI